MEEEMQCKCGGEITRDAREIKTRKKAEEWMDYNHSFAPVMLNHFKCDGCGKEARIIEDMNGIEIFRKGI
jgi:hypothetical protein